MNNNWYLIDAKNSVLGRLSTKISILLVGKNNFNFSYNLLSGGYVVVINSSYVRVTGNKYYKKIYYTHSGYVGGLKKKSFSNLQKKDPNKIIINSVRGMLPKNKLGRLMIKRLKVYSGVIHKHYCHKLIKIF